MTVVVPRSASWPVSSRRTSRCVPSPVPASSRRAFAAAWRRSSRCRCLGQPGLRRRGAAFAAEVLRRRRLRPRRTPLRRGPSTSPPMPQPPGPSRSPPMGPVPSRPPSRSASSAPARPAPSPSSPAFAADLRRTSASPRTSTASRPASSSRPSTASPIAACLSRGPDFVTSTASFASTLAAFLRAAGRPSLRAAWPSPPHPSRRRAPSRPSSPSCSVPSSTPDRAVRRECDGTRHRIAGPSAVAEATRARYLRARDDRWTRPAARRDRSRRGIRWTGSCAPARGDRDRAGHRRRSRAATSSRPVERFTDQTRPSTEEISDRPARRPDGQRHGARRRERTEGRIKRTSRTAASSRSSETHG